jgi:hypothetical protein
LLDRLPCCPLGFLVMRRRRRHAALEMGKHTASSSDDGSPSSSESGVGCGSSSSITNQLVQRYMTIRSVCMAVSYACMHPRWLCHWVVATQRDVAFNTVCVQAESMAVGCAELWRGGACDGTQGVAARQPAGACGLVPVAAPCRPVRALLKLLLVEPRSIWLLPCRRPMARQHGRLGC